MKHYGTVTINGRDYKVRNTIRALLLYDRVKEKNGSQVETFTDNLAFLYCILLACNPDSPIGWDDYIEAIDDDPSLLQRINDEVANASELDRITRSREAGGQGQSEKKN